MIGRACRHARDDIDVVGLPHPYRGIIRDQQLGDVSAYEDELSKERRQTARDLLQRVAVRTPGRPHSGARL
jgi:hypothetical protein